MKWIVRRRQEIRLELEDRLQLLRRLMSLMPNLHWNKGKNAKQNLTSGSMVHMTQDSQKKKTDRINIYVIYYTRLHFTV